MSDYRKQWREYRSLRNLILTVAFLILALTLAGVAFEKFFAIGSIRLTGLIVIGSGLFSVAIVTVIRAENWKCPRYGKRFVSARNSRWSMFVVNRRANCDSAKFANG
jgi:hypothetical protein